MRGCFSSLNAGEFSIKVKNKTKYAMIFTRNPAEL